MSDNTDFKTKSIIKGKQKYFIMINESVQKEAITIVCLYTYVLFPDTN